VNHSKHNDYLTLECNETYTIDGHMTGMLLLVFLGNYKSQHPTGIRMG